MYDCQHEYIGGLVASLDEIYKKVYDESQYRKVTNTFTDTHMLTIFVTVGCLTSDWVVTIKTVVGVILCEVN